MSRGAALISDYSTTRVPAERKSPIVTDVIFAVLLVSCVVWPTRLEVGPLRWYTVPFIALVFFFLFGYAIRLRGLLKKWVPVAAVIVVVGIYCWYGFSAYRALCFTSYVLLAVLGYSFVTSRQQLMTLLDVLIGAFAVLGALGVVEALFHYNIFDAISHTTVEYYGANSIRFGLARSRGVSDLAINNCFYYLLALGMAIYRISTSENKVYPVVCYVLIAAGAVCTVSRGPIAVMIATQLVLALRAGIIKNIKRMLIVVGLVLAFFFTAYILFPDSLGIALDSFNTMLLAMFDTSAAASLSSEGIGGSGQRANLYAWVASYMYGHEFLGLGPDAQFIYLMSNGVLKESLENAYLGRWFHTGYFGLCASLVFFGSIAVVMLRRIWRSAPFESERGWRLSFGFALAVCYLGYLVCGFVADFGQEIRLVYLLIGIFVAYESMLEPSATWVARRARTDNVLRTRVP